MKEYVLYAVKDGWKAWQEDIITATIKLENIERAKEWAKSQGYTKFRVSVADLNHKPDFTATIK